MPVPSNCIFKSLRGVKIVHRENSVQGIAGVCAGDAQPAQAARATQEASFDATGCEGVARVPKKRSGRRGGQHRARAARGWSIHLFGYRYERIYTIYSTC